MWLKNACLEDLDEDPGYGEEWVRLRRERGSSPYSYRYDVEDPYVEMIICLQPVDRFPPHSVPQRLWPWKSRQPELCPLGIGCSQFLRTMKGR